MQIYSRLDRTTDPAKEAVSLAEAKQHLRVDHNDDDALISGYIVAAREAVEAWLRRSLITQTWTMYLDYWPGREGEDWWSGERVGSIDELHAVGSKIPIPMGPVQAITTFKVFDDDDTETAVASTAYYLRTGTTAEIVLRNGSVWPAATRSADAIEVVYTAGYGDDWNAVPMPIRQAILIWMAHLYENREVVVTGTIVTKIPVGASSLLTPYKAVYIR